MVTSEQVKAAINAPFGSVLTDHMAVCHFRDGQWTTPSIVPTTDISISPAAHVLHYSSTIFEGLKVHRWPDGTLNAFRLKDHLKRFQNSAAAVCLPVAPIDMMDELVRNLVNKCADWVPEFPGSLYVRPFMIGTSPQIGAAAHPSKQAMLMIILAPVGDYFKGGIRPLTIAVETEQMRAVAGIGDVKTGGNYASALKLTVEARKTINADQVLFAPDGIIQETGAANFFLFDDRTVLTKDLDGLFLPGITRDSLLTIARDLDYQVEERPISVDEMLEFVKSGEAALSGTAAVLAGIGQLVINGTHHQVGSGEVGANTLRLREALLDIQRKKAPDTHKWLERL